MRRYRISVFLLLSLPLCATAQNKASRTRSSLRFEVTLPAAASHSKPFTGHLVLAISKDFSGEPRFQINDSYTSQQAFGVDVKDFAPGKTIVVDDTSVGFPIERLSNLPPGDYNVQAILNVYEQYKLATGNVVELPPDHGEGQNWTIKPGNLLSTPQKIHLDPRAGGTIRITLNSVMPPLDPEQIASEDIDASIPLTQSQAPSDNRWLKHVRMRSEKLSKFWGRDVYLSAYVLLPQGWAQHPDAHYPLIVWQDHFHRDFSTTVAFRSTPPTPDMKGFDRTYAAYSYKFYQDWTSGRLPHVLLLYVQNANPYYDDSYAVNSANLGPYGDAITEELIPQIEKRYRGIGQGWARATYGGSTGGWEALASQIFYPDFYNGVWASCPDPIDFHAYQNVDLYHDTNAYFRFGDFDRIPIPEERDPNGTINAEMEPANRYEYVLGTHGRSGEQFDIWQAVFSPMGADGYPRPIYDKRTGVIDKTVVAYWHDHYDLDAILQKNWQTLGPRLEGKIHITVGDADTFYLNNAVHLMQNYLKTTRHPHSDATFDYGPGLPHCYFGDASVPEDVGALTVNQRVLPQMVDHMLQTAPAGADVTSWRY
ncbi:MAG TPA: alpha/beta hydrolase-fold protein [Acidobacteriaceae bacterium]|nr:alpha/beta hydrolase-fold protein [Acidobacteriaceae bacterium]